MQIAKFALDSDPTPRIGLVEGDRVRPLAQGVAALTELLHSEDLPARAATLSARTTESLPLAQVTLLAPLDLQETWGAGVTYERSKVARQEESEGAAKFYDLVYRASRPELFFKVGQDQIASNYKVRHTRTYTIKNRSMHERKIVVEHPITAGWKLLEPEKPADKSRDVYRFEVTAAANKTLVFKVREITGPPPLACSNELAPPIVPSTRPLGAPNNVPAPDLARRMSVSAMSRL